MKQGKAGVARRHMLLVPFGPGGSADLTARAAGREMAAILGQPAVVDTKPSAGAIAGSQQARIEKQ